MRRVLIGTLSVAAILGAAATVTAHNVDRRNAANSGTAGAVGMRVAANDAHMPGTVGLTDAPTLMIAHEDVPGSWNAPGGSSQTSMMISDAQKAAVRRRFDLLDGSNLIRPSLRGLAIGAKLSREKIRISRLPAEIVQIVPKYGAYEYFITDNGSVVIVDPGTYEIVDLIGA